jgi:hypothetical protein
MSYSHTATKRACTTLEHATSGAAAYRAGIYPPPPVAIEILQADARSVWPGITLTVRTEHGFKAPRDCDRRKGFIQAADMSVQGFAV